MTRIELASEVLAQDFQGFFAHWNEHQVSDAAERIADLLDAIDILAHSPLIGRPTRSGTRELVVGTRSRAYVALYRYLPDIDTAFVLSVRHQREDSRRLSERSAAG